MKVIAELEFELAYVEQLSSKLATMPRSLFWTACDSWLAGLVAILLHINPCGLSNARSPIYIYREREADRQTDWEIVDFSESDKKIKINGKDLVVLFRSLFKEELLQTLRISVEKTLPFMYIFYFRGDFFVESGYSFQRYGEMVDLVNLTRW